MKNAIISLFLLFIAVQYVAAQKKVIKIACIGNSITYGVGTRNPAKDSYPAVLGQMLGDGYEVRNFGVSARTMLMKGDNPYMKEERYRQALDYNPDIVTIKLGTNDTKPQNWRYKSDFKKDMETMIRTLRALPSKPEIYLCYPIPAYAVQWGINDSIIVHGVMPVINRLAAKYGLKVIDLHTPLTGMKECFADNVHPNEKAAVRIAQGHLPATDRQRNHRHMFLNPSRDLKVNGKGSINILLLIRIGRLLLSARNMRQPVTPGSGVLLFSVLLLQLMKNC